MDIQKESKAVLSNDARQSFRGGGMWIGMGGYPVIISKDHQYILYFTQDENGNIVGWQGLPPGVSDKQHNAFSKGIAHE